MLPVPQWYAATSGHTDSAGCAAPAATGARRPRLVRLVGIALMRLGRVLARRGGARARLAHGGFAR